MAKISTYGVDSTPSLGDKVIGTDVADNNATKNYLLSDIYNLFVSQGGGGGYVPYSGATNDVDLGAHTITADSFIVNGGTSSGFLKADGSVDTTAYVTISTNQTITGIKTFNNDTIFNDYVEVNKFRDYGVKINYSTDVSTSAGNPTQAGLYVINSGLNGYALAVDEVSTNVSGGQYPVTIRSLASSGTPAIGMATGIHFAVQDDSGAPAIGQMAFRTTDAVAASYTMRWEMRMKNLGTYQTNFMLLGDGSLALGYNGTAPSHKLDVNGDARIATITQAAAEVDKILVSDSGVIKYRTATQILNESVHYGSFYDTTDQIGGSAKAMTLNSTDALATNGVSIANNSQITFPKEGVYNVAFSAQFNKTGGSAYDIYIWLKIGNTNVPDSATWLQMANNNDYLVAAWNFLIPIQTAGDYCEIFWYTASSNVQIAHIDTGLPSGVPNVPSVIVTVNQVG